MLRTHTCGELRLTDANKQVILAGWVQRQRDKGSVLWIDLRDRYGITQLIFEEGKTEADLFQAGRSAGREYVVQVEGVVTERLSKNDKIPTGEIELKVTKLTVLNAAKLPPFTIEDETDGGDDLRMKSDTLICAERLCVKNFSSVINGAANAFIFRCSKLH